MRDHVDEVDGDEPLRHRHFCPVPDATQMVCIAERHHARAVFLCPLDRHLHRFAADRLAVAFAAVEREQRAGIEGRLRMRVRREPALEDRVDVAGNHADAMRVVAEQVRRDQIFGDERDEVAELLPCSLNDDAHQEASFRLKRFIAKRVATAIRARATAPV